MKMYKYIYQFNGGEYIFYAESRVKADEQYKKLFKVDYATFLRREPF
jgi:hypothetical protein